MRTNIHALSRIRTHDPSNQPAKTHASDHTPAVTGITNNNPVKLNLVQFNSFIRVFANSKEPMTGKQ
jgi:hypothetical protein